MRLAVTWATQPLSNSSRALTMSSCPPKTAAPTAETAFTGDPTSASRQVEVVDHQVEHRADVDGPAGERPVPLGLDELRADRPFDQFLEGRVEPLDVPDLEGHARAIGQGDEIVGLGHRAADRLLDQDGHAGLEEGRGHRVVMDRRRDDADGVNVRQERLEANRTAGVEAFGDGPGLFGIGINDADEFHVGQIGQNAGVMLAQVPDSDHRHPQACHFYPGDRRDPLGRMMQRHSILAARRSMIRDGSREPTGQFHVQSVTRTIRDHMPGEVEPAQREVADHVEHLVAGRLVGEAQAIVDRSAIAEDDDVGWCQVLADTLGPQRFSLGGGHERPAGRDFSGELAGANVERECLTRDRREEAVVEQVTDPKFDIGRWMEANRRRPRDTRMGALGV